jgi:hypothetical protein
VARVAAQAVLLEAAGQTQAALEAFEHVLQEWSGWGNALEQAHAAWGAGRCLAALGRAAAARERLAAAEQLFGDLGADAAQRTVRSFRSDLIRG